MLLSSEVSFQFNPCLLLLPLFFEKQVYLIRDNSPYSSSLSWKGSYMCLERGETDYCYCFQLTKGY